MTPRAGSITIGSAAPPVVGVEAVTEPDPWTATGQAYVDGLLAAWDRNLSRAAMLAEYNRLTSQMVGAPVDAADEGVVARILDAYEVTRRSDDRRRWFTFITHAREGSTLWENVVYRELPESQSMTTLILLLIGGGVLLGGIWWFAIRNRQARRYIP